MIRKRKWDIRNEQSSYKVVNVCMGPLLYSEVLWWQHVQLQFGVNDNFPKWFTVLAFATNISWAVLSLSPP